jgi:membrane associated rhomboid family serine protease
MTGFTAAAKLALGIVVMSVLYALTADSVGAHLVLTPARVFQDFEVWQVATYSLIADSPMGVIFGALIAWQMGGALEMTWGSRRTLLFALGVTVAAGALTVALALLPTPLANIRFPGAYVLTGSLWVAYGLSFGTRQTNFWGVPVTGNVFALLGVGFMFLQGAFSSFWLVVPEALALGLTFLYVRGHGPSMLWTRFSSWRLRNQLKARSKHLKVLGRDRNMGSGSDDFLH